jgi:hypothetical protein
MSLGLYMPGKRASLTKAAMARVCFLCLELFKVHPCVLFPSIDPWPSCVFTLLRSALCRFITAVLPTNHLFGHCGP